MNCVPIQTILIVGIGGGESAFWMQILVFLLLAVGGGVYSLVKNKRKEFRDRQQKLAEEARSYNTRGRWRFQPPGEHVGLRHGDARKYMARTQDMQLDVPKLTSETILGADTTHIGMRDRPENERAGRRGKDLHSGMELLELPFLVRVVEKTKGNSRNDVTMRKLNFKELLRREQLDRVNSKALKVYAINQSNLYGKAIQCEAMRELAERTPNKSEHDQLQPDHALSV
ncbi:MAG: hypothetical protein ACYS8I_07885 [Planctomycetota bacterium]|jgi:hypothetical protein